MWRARSAEILTSLPVDVRVAEIWLCRLDLTLRAVDGIYIAIAQRISAVLATFDAKTASCARALGLQVAGA